MPIVRKSALANYGEGNTSDGVAMGLGLSAIMDFYTYLAYMGATYQVRAGTITTPIVGDVVLTDTAAEYCADALVGTTIIPIFQNISIRLATGTLHEYATKSVGAVSSAGTTTFVPLPLIIGGAAAVTTARVGTAGGVTVTAELSTTTRRHWSWSNPAAGATGALPTSQGNLDWNPRMTAAPLFLKGPVCLYTQIAATGTGPSYYASLDYAEVPTATLF